MGIVESEAASSAQIKGAGTVGAGIRVSEMMTEDESEGEMVGNGGSVCVDMVAVEGGGMERMFVWTEAVAVVGVEVTR